MKLLILSCGTGQGHNSAARALEEACRRRQIECVTADPLSFGQKKTAHVVAATYNGIIKNTPRAFGAIYKAGDLFSNTHLTSPVYYANTLYAKNLGAYITDNRFTAVICTHLFAMEALTKLRKDPRFTVPCYGVLTDYTCIPFLAETRLNGYFIPHEDLTEEMLEKGMPADRLIPSGIPVREAFTRRTDKAEARLRLGLPQDRPLLLIMSGGVGCGPLTQLCRALLERQTAPFTACVLTGRNRTLQAEIDARFGDTGCFRTVAFTDEVPLYMNAADVTVSKPGGLTSTEAAVARTPLVHLLAFSGCETRNAAFFAAHGLSLRAGDPEEAADCAFTLVNQPAQAARMQERQRQQLHGDAADRILTEVTAS